MRLSLAVGSGLQLWGFGTIKVRRERTVRRDLFLRAWRFFVFSVFCLRRR